MVTSPETGVDVGVGVRVLVGVLVRVGVGVEVITLMDETVSLPM